MTVRITGEAALLKRLVELAKKYPEAAAQALYEEGLGVDANMVPRIPVDTGRLRSTHYVAPPRANDQGGIFVEVGVGTDYAAEVHERTEIRHVSGEAKFLEKALNARASGMAQRLATRIASLGTQGRGMRPLAAGGGKK